MLVKIVNPDVTSFVASVDKAFLFIIGVSLIFLVGITAVMVYFIIRYNKKRHPVATQVPDNNWLEISWTVIPTILALMMFYYGYVAFIPMRNIPANAMVVKTTAKMWSWSFQYQNGKQSEELVVPLNKPIKLSMNSLDVIHSLYMPTFRVKEDVVPGKETHLWFLPDQLGTYDIFCAEYCGLRHSYMLSKVKVVTEQEFNKWVAEQPKQEKESKLVGLDILKANNCLACHSIDGTRIVGPTFMGLYGNSRVVETSAGVKTVKATDEYILNSIYEPDKEVVQTFPKGLMQSYKTVLKKEDIQQIIDYLKTLHSNQ